MDQKTMVYLHSGILCCREKGAPTFCNSMGGTGEHYTKWNKPGGEGQILYDFLKPLIVAFHIWSPGFEYSSQHLVGA